MLFIVVNHISYKPNYQFINIYTGSISGGCNPVQLITYGDKIVFPW